MGFLCYSTCKSQAEDLFQVADSLINLASHSLLTGLSFCCWKGIACCVTDKRDPVTDGIKASVRAEKGPWVSTSQLLPLLFFQRQMSYPKSCFESVASTSGENL